MPRTLLAIILLFVLVTIIFSIPAVQTSLAKKATDSLNKEFGTNIQIERIRFSPFNMGVYIKSIYVEDYQGDTLINIDKVSTSVLSLKNMVDGQLQFGDFDLDGLSIQLKNL